MIEAIEEAPDKVWTPEEVARKWWRTQCRPGPDTSAARATRAKLRRAGDWQAAMLIPAGILLVKQLGLAEAKQQGRIETTLSLAHVLSHVEEDSRVPLMRAVGFKTTPRPGAKETEPPRLSRQRFERLLKSSDDELPKALVRLVRLMDGKANVAELTSVMMGWFTQSRKDRICRDWAFDYYAASDAKPETD
jgi:CRISPR system Cascade subunit CasB